MNLKQLQVFVAVVESGSFSKGAEAAYITQSTVSQHISALENEFGVKLLDRTGKGVLPTPAGEILLRHARQVLAGAQGISQALSRFKGVAEGVLKAGGSTIPGSYLIPQALPLLLGRFPGLQLTLLQGDSRDIMERIAREEVEIGVIGSRFDMEGFDFTPFGRDEIRLTVAGDHRWGGRRLAEAAELEEETFILREPGSGTGKTVMEALQGLSGAPLKLKVKAYLGSNEAIKQAVAGGVGVSFISEVSVRREVERGELAHVEVEGLAISRRFHLAQRKKRELSPAARAFADLMLELFGG